MALDKDIGGVSYTPGPTTPVKDTTTADVIGLAVQAGETLFEGKVTSDFRKEVEGIEGEYIRGVLGNNKVEGDANEPAATFYNEPPVQEFREKASTVKNGVEQGAITGNQARVMLESTLKSYMSRHPYFSSEFKGIVSEVTGINPLGTAFALAEELEKERSTGNEDAFKRIIQHHKELGGDMTLWAEGRTEEAIADYQMLVARKRNFTEASQEHDLRQWGHQDTADAQRVRMGRIVPSLLMDTKKYITDKLGPLAELSNESFLAKIGDNGPALENELDTMWQTVRSEYGAKYSHLPATEVDNYLAPVKETIEAYKSVVRGESRLEDVKRHVEFLDRSVELRMRMNPDVNEAMVLLNFFKGVPETLFSAADTRRATDDAIFTVLKHFGRGINNPEANPWPAMDNQEKGKYIETLRSMWQKAKDKSVVMGQEDVDKLGNVIMSGTNAMVYTPAQVENVVYSEYADMIADPDFYNRLKNYSNWDELRENLYVGMDTYLSRMAKTLSNDLTGDFSGSPGLFTSANMPIDQRGKKIKSLSEAVDISFDGGNLRFVTKPEFATTPSATQMTRKLNSAYGTKINKLARAYSHIRGDTNYGKTVEELAARFFHSIEPFKSQLEAVKAADTTE